MEEEGDVVRVAERIRGNSNGEEGGEGEEEEGVIESGDTTRRLQELEELRSPMVREIPLGVSLGP